MHTRNLIGTPVCVETFDEQIKLIVTWAKNYQSKVVCVANTHMLIEARRDPQLTYVLKHADLVTPDGVPLVWMMKMLGVNQAQRVAGIDIFPAACDQASKAQISIFLMGSTPEVLDKIRHRLKDDFPQLKIAGMVSPPFSPIGSTADMDIAKTINESGAGIVFVALGCPKQELWMNLHKEKIHAVMIGLGAVFPIYAGLLKKAPNFIQNTGFVWLFRLAQEPQRLWKRYLSTIPIFIWLALKQIYFNPNHLDN